MSDEAGRQRVVIEGVEPEIDGGRFPIKRVVGERVVVEADIFSDGTDALTCRLLYRGPEATGWSQVPLLSVGNDRWRGELTVTGPGRWRYTVSGWVDPFKTWRRDLPKRSEAGRDLAAELLVGAALVRQTSRRAEAAGRRADARVLAGLAADLEAGTEPQARLRLALDGELAALMERLADRRFASYHRELEVVVDRAQARFSTWYEMFPRSTGAEGRHGTFLEAEARLPYVAAMGFDVLALPPIHPIGRTGRRGANDRAPAEPGEVGSPWAVGAAEGGHKAIHPELGTAEDFCRFVDKAREQGLEIALELAWQVSPDHPLVREHPEWFRPRPQEVLAFDFEAEAWRDLWQELKSVVDHWVAQGVRIFRLSDPQTRPFPFWEWLLAAVKREHPDVLFLAGGLTRPKPLARLAKLGFTWSASYFPWRNSKAELTEYFTELTATRLCETFRPHLWPNTPDLLTEPLQMGGRPVFAQRLILAATLGASYGVYGPAFELMESAPLERGSEEYLDAETYQLRTWDLEREDSLAELIGRVNRIRQENPALQTDRGLRFHHADNPQILCYSKVDATGDNVILVAVNLDPHHTQSGWLELDVEALGVPRDQPYQVHDLLTKARYLWHGSRNFVQLDPQAIPAQIFRVRRRVRSERDSGAFT